MITVLQTIRNHIRHHLIFLIFLSIACTLYFSGLDKVPFHPDESTQIYMSSDLLTLLSQPFSLSVQSPDTLDQKQIYRLLDAPLTRYLIGIERLLTSTPAVDADWDWSKTWRENQESGALPLPNELWNARLSVAMFFPFTLLLTYWIGCTLDGRLTGTSCMLFLATDALVQLHTRRAMAESTLLFGVVAFIAVLISAPNKPWLLGVVAALAFAAKQFALAMLPAGILSMFWQTNSSNSKNNKNIFQPLIFLVVFLLVTFLLNPVAWLYPLDTIDRAIHLREDLIQRQVNEIGQMIPEQILTSPGDRLIILLANLYLTPPMTYEIGNYREDLSAASNSYLANPLHKIFRSTTGAGFTLMLTLLGMLWVGIQLLRNGGEKRRILILLLMVMISLVIGFTIMVPLSWQRYVIPLVPFAAIFSGIGFSQIIKTSRELITGGRFLDKSAKVFS